MFNLDANIQMIINKKGAKVKLRAFSNQTCLATVTYKERATKFNVAH